MKWLLTLSLILLPMSLYANESLLLKVRPTLCIIDERTPNCQITFLIYWESAETGYYCLYNDFGQSPLRCWTERRSGEHSDERIVDREFRYWISSDDDQSRLAVETIEVLRMDTDDRRRRRRSRHVWDIIE